METTTVCEKLARRRSQVRRAVAKWRIVHREKYNAYTREYLKRPEARKRHLARCKRYRQKKKLARIQAKMEEVLVPTLEIKQESDGSNGPVGLVAC